MATKLYTRYQKDHADVLVQRAKFWTRGVRKSDRLAFVIFPSSRATAEKPTAYYTTERGCTCPSFYHRGSCAHELAVRTVARQDDLRDNGVLSDGECELMFTLAFSGRL